MMTPDEIELDRLTTMLRARTNGDDPKPGYKQNVKLLRTRIAQLQARIAALSYPDDGDIGAGLVARDPEPQP